MKITLLMNQNSYLGREILNFFSKKNLPLDILSIGNHPEKDIIEDKRCGGMWNPTTQKILEKNEYFKFFHFDNMTSKNFYDFLNKKNYDFAIQGGVGIIKKELIEKFNKGIINFHPGLLPYYRGSSTPEWQILNGDDVYSSCHFIDEGIDSGKIIETKKINISKKSYNHFRASIYPEIAKHVYEVYRNIINDKNINGTEQNEKDARYWPIMKENELKKLKFFFYQ